ncbi:MAG: plasmid mobilization relaxosome protein MobC [Eubacteriales bacterium]|nr:plasmid mobilization relaxosome protein MobC [Eubacteriales bacterium]
MNRTQAFIVRMNKAEMQALDKKVKRTGMSREGYVRTLCNNKTPVELPPADYYALIREVRALGNNLHQIAYKANAQGLLDTPLFKHHADNITAVADKLTAVCLPRDNG